MKRPVIIALLLNLLVAPVWAEKLTVGVAGSPPFVIEGEPIDGLAVRIWKDMAIDEEVEYDLIRYPSVSELLRSVADQEVDVGVGPLSITAQRANYVEFTQPYYRTDLGILSHTKTASTWQIVKPFLTRNFLYALCILLTILTVVGGLVWAAERKANPEEFPAGAAGLGNGMWFAIVTMTTVGYGDRSPVTPLGRLLTSVWMLVATISFSTLTAGIATALTLSTLGNTDITLPSQLKNHRVAVVSGTTGSSAARQFGAVVLLNEDLNSAVEMLVNNQADAVVFDYPALEYYLHRHSDRDLKLATTHFNEQDYGFAVRLGSRRAHQLDLALLKLSESGRLKEIEDSWLIEARGAAGK